jgi:hypothetical protein
MSPYIVLLIRCHMVDIMTKVALFSDVTDLAIAVAGLCKGFEGLSAVDVHWNTGGECTRRGVHCCRGCGGGGMSVEEGEWSVQRSGVCHQRGSRVSGRASGGKVKGLIH